MKLPNDIRLGIEDGVCHLYPEDPSTPNCIHCAATWSLPIVVKECTVVTEKQVFNARG